MEAELFNRYEGMTNMAGSIDLLKAFTVERCGVTYHNHNNVFKLHTSGRTYYISATSTLYAI